MNFEKLFKVCKQYHHKFYGDGRAELPTEERSALKVGEECGELQGAIAKSWAREKREDECLDIIFATMGHMLNCNYNIEKAIQRAIEKQKIRMENSQVVNGTVVKFEDLVDKEIKDLEDGPPKVCSSYLKQLEEDKRINHERDASLLKFMAFSVLFVITGCFLLNRFH